MKRVNIVKLTDQVGRKGSDDDSGGTPQDRPESRFTLPEWGRLPEKRYLHQEQHGNQGDKPADNRLSGLFPAPYFVDDIGTDKSNGVGQNTGRHKKPEYADYLIGQNGRDRHATDKNADDNDQRLIIGTV